MSAIFVKKSQNKKLGEVSSTWVSQETCPKECPFQNSGCYAENGHAGIVTRRLNKASLGMGTLEIAKKEAELIIEFSKMKDARPLRLHVVGDCPNTAEATIVANAARIYTRVTQKPVWSYTHAWRTVPGRVWDGISVLASCENPSQVKEAKEKGYATAMAVEKFPSTKLFVKDGVKVIPCLNQTLGKTCDECKLCWKAEYLKEKDLTIGFEAHGSGKKKAVEALNNS